MQVNSHPPTQGIHIKNACREWLLSVVTPEPPSGTFLRLLHPAQAKIVPADSARNWKVWKFYFLPSTQRTKAEWSCFPERHKNQKWCLYCAWTGSRVHAPACCPVWHPSEESVPHAVPDGSFLCTHRHFLPLARKMSPEEQRRCTASRGRELGHLKTKQKKMALKKGRKRAKFGKKWKPRMDFYFFLFL